MLLYPGWRSFFSSLFCHALFQLCKFCGTFFTSAIDFCLQDSHIEEHSKKPDEARRRIVELMGDLPRIELFARQKADGWDAWGNEVACDIALTGGEPNVG